MPCAVIGPRASESPLAGATALIDTGVAGIHEGGTAIRMDDVPLPLRPSIAGRRSAADVVRAAAASAWQDDEPLRIAGGTVYDPANGIDGDVRDVCIDDGRIVADVPPSAMTIDARGMVVMPGGVDIHSHVASGSVNLARRLLPGGARARSRAGAGRSWTAMLPRSGTGGTVPSTFTTGYRYAGLGYTTVFDAAVAPLSARLSHAEFDDTPIVDGGFFVLMGNDEYLLRLIDAGERERRASTPRGCLAPPAATRSRS